MHLEAAQSQRAPSGSGSQCVHGNVGDGANLDPLKLKDAYFEQKPRAEQPLDHRQPMTLTHASFVRDCR